MHKGNVMKERLDRKKNITMSIKDKQRNFGKNIHKYIYVASDREFSCHTERMC